MRAPVRLSPWAALALFACLRDAPLEDARCPCVSGYQCCAQTGRCISEGAACPAGDATTAPTLDARPEPVPDGAPDADAREDAKAVPVDAGHATDGGRDAGAADGEVGRLEVAAFEPAEGPQSGGTRVALRGRGFTPDVHVRFGAHAALAVEVQDEGHLVATTPPGPLDVSAVDVSVQTADAHSTAPTPFRYVLPVLTDVTEATGVRVGRGVGLLALDADADGVRDLMVARTVVETVSLWRGRGGLTFEPAHEAAGLASLDYFESVAPIGLRPGAPLQVATLRTFRDNTERVYLLDGLVGAGGRRWEPDGVDAAASWDDLVPLDFDGDGDIDLAGIRVAPLWNPETRAAGSLYRNDGGRLVAAPEALTLGVEGVQLQGVMGIVAGDVDADGRVDLLLLEDGRPVVYFGRAEGLVRGPAHMFPTWPEGLVFRAPLLADLDADGQLDLALAPSVANDAELSGAGLFVLRGGAEGFTLESPWAWPGPAVECPAEVPAGATLPIGRGGAQAADLDLDGDLDLVFPSPYFVCTIASVWAESGRVDTGAPFVAVHTVGSELPGEHTASLADDLDGDGDPDIAVHSWRNGLRTRVFRNNTIENRGTSAARTAGWLRVRVRNRQDFVPYGARVELDLDGPAEAPDFAPGPGRLAVRLVGGHSAAGFNDGTISFGTGAATGPFHVRVLLPDGPLQARAEGPDQEVSLGP